MWRILFLILFLFSSIYLAQTQEKPKAIKVDELNTFLDDPSDSRIYSFRDAWKMYPKSSVVVIAYQSIDAFPSDYHFSPIVRGLNREIDWFKLDRSKIKIIFGGFRQKVTAELWIVPEG